MTLLIGWLRALENIDVHIMIHNNRKMTVYGWGSPQHEERY